MRVRCERASLELIDHPQPDLRAKALREPDAPSRFVAKPGGNLATTLLSAVRKGAIAACVGVMLGPLVGTALASTAHDPGKQMLVSRTLDGALVIDAGDRDDDIEISRSKNGSVRVTVNGSSRDFAAIDAGRIVVRGNGGDDQIRVRPGTNMRGIELQLEGGAGNDRIIGSDGHDVLVGGEGDDELWGRKGNDLLLGGAGNDRLQGEEGRDILIGAAGDDLLDGGPGNDLLDGGRGQNTVDGGAGKNKILGEPIGEAGKALVIRGSPEFVSETEAALDLLRSTRTGRALLEAIDASGHKVVIVEVGGPDASAVHVDTSPTYLKKNGERGAGTDATIAWDPKFRGEVRGPAWAYNPPAVILGHELVHAFNMVTGTMPPDVDDERSPPAAEELAVGLRFDHDGRKRTKKIEVATYYQRLGLPAVSENLLRKELGWAIRTRY